MGTLQTQNVRNKSKPVIMEMDKYMYEMEKEAIGMKLDGNLLSIFIDRVPYSPQYKSRAHRHF